MDNQKMRRTCRNRRSCRGLLYALLALLYAGICNPALAQVTGPSASLDLCDCEEAPSLGDFVASDSSTWPEGMETSGPDDLTMPLPSDGVMVFDSFVLDGTWDIYFAPNAANSPVTLLVKGDVTMNAGSDIVVDGEAGSAGEANGTGGVPGRGGPGGFAGGRGAYQLGHLTSVGGDGLGPGGGRGSVGVDLAPEGGGTISSDARGGSRVGGIAIQPLVGGSGGGGGASTSADEGCAGGGGGGGGGALLIVANGSLELNGYIYARGGTGAFNAGGVVNWDCTDFGAGGAGGSVRLLARNLSGSGAIDVSSQSQRYGRSTPPGGDYAYYYTTAGDQGRIRLEAALVDSSGYNTNGAVASRGVPGPVDLLFAPSVRVTAIDGVAVPEQPIGHTGGIDFIASSLGAHAVALRTEDVPSGTTVEVKIKPQAATDTRTTTTDFIEIEEGSCDGAQVCTPSASVELEPGRYILEARATFEEPAL